MQETWLEKMRLHKTSGIQTGPEHEGYDPVSRSFLRQKLLYEEDESLSLKENPPDTYPEVPNKEVLPSCLPVCLFDPLDSEVTKLLKQSAANSQLVKNTDCQAC